MNLADTIAAIATAIAPQQGSVGIVRLSGSEAKAIAGRIFRAASRQQQNPDHWQSHQVIYGWVLQPETSSLIDECLLLWMQGPRSFTREDVVEFHCHGGIIAVQEVLQTCLEQGARLAEPGEFSLRAFLNGRIDLTQAESIHDLVAAQSKSAAQSALAGLQGKLAQALRQLRRECVDILAEIEARIDFEDDLPPLDVPWIQERLQQVSHRADEFLRTADRGELLRTGLKVAIVGRPNVGKSSLLNAWSRTDRAIVTDLPGTTRDVVDSQLVVGGIPIQVLDTAGIRETEDLVEQIGVKRSRQAAQQADLVLMVIDASVGWTPADQEIYEMVQDQPTILVRNKVDLILSNSLADQSLPQDLNNEELIRDRQLKFLAILNTAAAQQQGITELETAILDNVSHGMIHASNLDVTINQRQKACLLRVVTALHHVQEAINQALPLDFWTIDLRSAISAIGEITGEEVTESVLEQIFSRFCIGK
ncbi:MAG: tRNA uridine-5-carboxymethylaminomethyl(34) synthesis GTPase MnmE [Pseudanabaena sp. ELA607]